MSVISSSPDNGSHFIAVKDNGSTSSDDSNVDAEFVGTNQPYRDAEKDRGALQALHRIKSSIVDGNSELCMSYNTGLEPTQSDEPRKLSVESFRDRNDSIRKISKIRYTPTDFVIVYTTGGKGSAKIRKTVLESLRAQMWRETFFRGVVDEL